jgi:hypothetical protein
VEAAKDYGTAGNTVIIESYDRVDIGDYQDYLDKYITQIWRQNEKADHTYIGADGKPNGLPYNMKRSYTFFTPFYNPDETRTFSVTDGMNRSVEYIEGNNEVDPATGKLIKTEVIRSNGLPILTTGVQMPGTGIAGMGAVAGPVQDIPYNFQQKVVRYAFYHMTDHAPGLKVGQRIKQGDLLGHVGDAGSPGSVHGHFELRLVDTAYTTTPIADFYVDGTAKMACRMSRGTLFPVPVRNGLACGAAVNPVRHTNLGLAAPSSATAAEDDPLMDLDPPGTGYDPTE